MDGITVRLADLPTTIKAYVVSNPDCTYTIVLNSHLNHEQHMLSYAHEFKHIQNGDYDRKGNVDLIELHARQ